MKQSDEMIVWASKRDARGARADPGGDGARPALRAPTGATPVSDLLTVTREKTLCWVARRGARWGFLKILLALAFLLPACGGPFSAADVALPSDGEAGASGAVAASEAGAPSAGSSPADDLGRAGAPDGGSLAAGGRSGIAGSGGAPGAPGSGGASGAGGSGIAPPCSPWIDGDPSGEADIRTMGAVCLRISTPFNTVSCTDWVDNRSITVNGAPASCNVPMAYPASADGVSFIAVGPGTSSMVPIVRWFLTAPSPFACSARAWGFAGAYLLGEIQTARCDDTGGGACKLGEEIAFSCVDQGTCASQQPGKPGWPASWKIEAHCP